MPITIFLFLFAALLIVSLLLNAAFLWVAARLVRVPEATYRRSLAATLAVNLVGCPVAALAGIVAWRNPAALSPTLEWSLLATQIALIVVCIKWGLRTTWGKALLAWLITMLPASIYAAALVFVLKTWVMEAFVIPTGGMAETLWGYHKTASCPQCGYSFAVNASAEATSSPGRLRSETVGCTYPNCRYAIEFQREDLKPPLETGDRILVPKLGQGGPERLQPVVFRYPVTSMQDGSPVNYVKRLVGLPGETVAIHRGKLYRCADLSYDWRDRPASPEEARAMAACYAQDDQTVEAFKKGKFEIIRKPPDRLLALSRLVYDNDHQARDLAGKQAPRWTPEKGNWKADDDSQPRRFQHSASAAEQVDWLRYRHLLRGATKPALITDFSGYNSDRAASGRPRGEEGNWVSELLLECTVNIEKAEGELRLELCKAADRYQARFALASGECALVRIGPKGEEELGKTATEMNRPGEFRLRFANVDDRLTVWVNDRLPFGDGVAYQPAPSQSPVAENDLSPAAIGVRHAALTVSRLVLRRDTYFTLDPSTPDVTLAPEAWTDPDAWGPLQKLPVQTFFVQPGHYFCLGDNSPSSADSRVWGLVPESHLLGPAELRYWPPPRSGWVR